MILHRRSESAAREIVSGLMVAPNDRQAVQNTFAEIIDRVAVQPALDHASEVLAKVQLRWLGCSDALAAAEARIEELLDERSELWGDIGA